jgi:hypothetical protein
MEPRPLHRYSKGKGDADSLEAVREQGLKPTKTVGFYHSIAQNYSRRQMQSKQPVARVQFLP